MKQSIQLFILLSLAAVLIVSCGPAANNDQPDNQTTTSETAAAPTAAVSGSAESAYPGVASASGYPGPAQGVMPEGTLSELPDPERSLPSPAAGSASVGGYLVRSIGEAGFLPAAVQSLQLGSVLYDDQGRQSLIAVGENAPSAELFATGVFVFANVPPGIYGLVVNIGYTEFPITVDGQPLLIEVEANTALDLGAVFVEPPE